MHILVVNDDGPPSRRLSPYIRPFVDALQDAGHRVSVAIPATSRSWIGKAHLIGASLRATYVPPDAFRDDGTWDPSPERARSDSRNDNDWVVVDNGTPASCAQLGLYSLFTDRGPIDLVVSGPNHGRNASTIYNLSSGTVGGALEAATCGKRGIALSFGSKEEQSVDVVRAAARLSVRLVEHLYRNWDDGVDIYNLNVPMRPDVESRPIRYARALPNHWSKGSLYAEVTEAGKEAPLPNGTADAGAAPTPAKQVNGCAPRLRERHFQWSTELSDITRSLEAAEEGTDAHTVLGGCTSVTPLLANFWHPPGFSGELKLDR
ncbi:putative acid phosphatase [Thermoascus aurantiacus ATCC 26904]